MFLVIFSFLLLGYSAANHQPVSQDADADKRPVCPCGSSKGSLNTRVVGGHDAGNGNFPYASCMLRGMKRIELLNSSMPFCGATLISDSHVITAAHCVKYLSPEDVLVDISDYDLMSEVSHLRRAKSIIRHPDYLPDKLYKDIALVEFERPVRWKSDMRAAVLPPPHLPLPAGVTVAVYGWGRMKYDGHHSDILQSAELPVVESGECQKSFWSTIQEDMLCAGGEEGHDACIGDSGSGLVVRLGNEYVLCGLVSFGRRCAMKNIPGVYTRVSSYIDWIYQNTMSSNCKPCIYKGATPKDSYVTASGNGTDSAGENSIPKDSSVTASGNGTDSAGENSIPKDSSVTASGNGTDSTEENSIPKDSSVTASGNGTDSEEENSIPKDSSVTASGNGTDSTEENSIPKDSYVTASGNGTDSAEENSIPKDSSVTASGNGTDSTEENSIPKDSSVTASGNGTDSTEENSIPKDSSVTASGNGTDSAEENSIPKDSSVTASGNGTDSTEENSIPKDSSVTASGNGTDSVAEENSIGGHYKTSIDKDGTATRSVATHLDRKRNVM